MKKSVTPYANQQDSKKKQVTQMFDGISTNYDFLNRMISLGIDIKWRKRVVKLLIDKKPETILDIATESFDSSTWVSVEPFFTEEIKWRSEVTVHEEGISWIQSIPDFLYSGYAL